MAKLKDVLNSKGNEIHTIWPTATLQDVVDLLVRHNCGSLLVVEGGQLLGIITERDIVQYKTLGLDFSQIQARDAMSSPLLPVQKKTPLWEAHQTITQILFLFAVRHSVTIRRN